MKKKKIGIVIPSLNHGGAEKSALILANKLQSEYESVDLISLCRNSKKIENESVNLISLNKTRVLFSIFQLYRLIKSKKYDCIITGLSHLNLIILLLNFFLKNDNRINLLLHFHNIPNINFFNLKERILNFFVFRFIKMLKFKNVHIITVSNSIKDKVSLKYNIDKKNISVIYPTIDFDKIDKLQLYKLPFDKKNEKIILTVGRLSKQKNHNLLIKSFADVRKLINCKLIIIGDGKLKKKLIKLTRDLNISNSVNFIDKTDNPYQYFKRKTEARLNIGGSNVPIVMADFSLKTNITPASLYALGYNYNVKDDKWGITDLACDYVFVNDKKIDFEIPGTLGVIQNYNQWLNVKNQERRYPFLTVKQYHEAVEIHSELNKKLRNILGTKKYKLLVDEAYENSNVMSRQVKGKVSLYQRVQSPQLSLIVD